MVCVARQQQTFLQRRFGWDAWRTPLALSGTDARFYAPDLARALPGDETASDVLSAGRDAGRDYATLLAAVANGGEGPRLRLVCSPRNLAGLALPAGVSVRYDISADALRDEYGAARTVAIPTQGDHSTAGSDCSGTLVLLDALAMGRPAVITQRDSVPDYVTPGDAGPDRPARGSRRRCGRPSTTSSTTRAGGARLARAGRERVLSDLTTVHFARRIAAVLREAV